MQLHCHCSICMSIVFTANAARPCKELRGVPIQWHTKPYHTMPHPAYDTWPQRTAPHRSRPDHTIPYPSSVVSRNLAVLLSGSSGWHTLIVTQTRSGPKLTDAETSYLVCYFFRLFSTLLALLFNHRPHNGKLLKQGMGNGERENKKMGTIQSIWNKITDRARVRVSFCSHLSFSSSAPIVLVSDTNAL